MSEKKSTPIILRNVLISGGGGFLGKELIRSLLKSSSLEKIIIFSRDELKHHELEKEFSYTTKLVFFLGDIRDIERINILNYKVDTIFHCAALKHVKYSTAHPTEFYKTNLVGTENLIEFAIKRQITNFVFFSTDKAVNPTNIYGKTKRDAEDLIIRYSAKNLNTNFNIIRFGNLLGSTGSIIPTIFNLIKRNLIPDIANLDTTRFSCTAKEISDLAIEIVLNPKFHNSLVIPKLKAFSLRDLVCAINLKQYNSIELKTGEKFSEELFTDEEECKLCENPLFLYYQFNNQLKENNKFKKYKLSHDADRFTIEELTHQINEQLKYEKK